jgi:hypothetical protein
VDIGSQYQSVKRLQCNFNAMTEQSVEQWRLKGVVVWPRHWCRSRTIPTQSNLSQEAFAAPTAVIPVKAIYQGTFIIRTGLIGLIALADGDSKGAWPPIWIPPNDCLERVEPLWS